MRGRRMPQRDSLIGIVDMLLRAHEDMRVDARIKSVFVEEARARCGEGGSLSRDYG
jgi:hypothetical protein